METEQLIENLLEQTTNAVNALLPDSWGLDGTAEGAVLLVFVGIISFFALINLGWISEFLAQKSRRLARRGRKK